MRRHLLQNGVHDTDNGWLRFLLFMIAGGLLCMDKATVVVVKRRPVDQVSDSLILYLVESPNDRVIRAVCFREFEFLFPVPIKVKRLMSQKKHERPMLVFALTVKAGQFGGIELLFF